MPSPLHIAAHPVELPQPSLLHICSFGYPGLNDLTFKAEVSAHLKQLYRLMLRVYPESSAELISNVRRWALLFAKLSE